MGVNGASAQQQFLYAANGAGGIGVVADLMILNPNTGEVEEVIGSIGHSITGLAFTPDGTLYACGTGDSDRLLIRINTVTGAGTVVGDMGDGADEYLSDIAISPQGDMYGFTLPTFHDLVTINKTTAVATYLGGTGYLDSFGNGLAFAPNGTLYFTGYGDTGPLGTFNLVTGQATSIVTLQGTNGWPIGGLAVNNAGVIYGVRKMNAPGSGPPAQADLITINPATGAITSLGVIRDASGPIPRMDSIAFSPIVCDVRTGFWVPAGELNQGSGVFIEIQRNTMALGWGAFDELGFPTYLFADASRVGTSNTFSGTLLSFFGGPTFIGGPVMGVTITPTGNISVQFPSDTAATASMSGTITGQGSFNKTINKTFGN